jgi:outer membrane protein assembly factor BamE (lipoprotein component of BamABCDE complex)
MFRTILACTAAFLACAGCQSAGQHRADVRDESTDRLTVGTVQREIHVGMPGAEVVRVLGAPNVVTTDEARREVWVYDKVATETVHSSSSGGVAALVLAGGADVAGGAGAGASSSAGATSRSQRTLTIVIRMDADGRVRDFSYRASQF